MSSCYVIVVEIPTGVSVAEAKEFCTDALETWGGQLHPEDPLFNSGKVHGIKRVPTASNYWVTNDRVIGARRVSGKVQDEG